MLERLDHINLKTTRLAETVHFYTAVLEMQAKTPVPGLDPGRYAWIYDQSGHAVFHVHQADSDALEGVGGTGRIDHVAFDCSAYEDVAARLTEHGVTFERNDIDAMGLRQILVDDPNGIRIELNFWQRG